MRRLISFLPAIALGIGILLVSGIREQYRMPPRSAMAALPKSLLGLESKDLEVSVEERQIAGMSDYVMRVFQQDTTVRFSLYVGYYDRQLQGKAIHSPKNCLPGAGWQIISSVVATLTDAPGRPRVNRVLLMNGGTRALVYYWYQGRGRIEASEYRVKWNLLRDAAIAGRTEEALVRLVLPLPSNGNPAAIAAADSTAQRIGAEIVPAVSRALPAPSKELNTVAARQ